MGAILNRYYHQTSFGGLAIMTICKHDVSHCMHQTVSTVCTRPYPTKTNWEFCAMMWKLKVLLSELKFSRGFHDFLTIIHKINNHLFTSTCWGDICTTVVDRKTLVQCQIVCLVRETTYATVILLAVYKSAFAKTRNKPLKGRDFVESMLIHKILFLRRVLFVYCNIAISNFKIRSDILQRHYSQRIQVRRRTGQPSPPHISLPRNRRFLQVLAR